LTCIPPEIWKNAQWQNGGTVGAGIDFMLAGNWVLGVEYNYIALASKNHGGVTSGSSFHVSDDEKSTLNMITGRISYKFGSQ